MSVHRPSHFGMAYFAYHLVLVLVICISAVLISLLRIYGQTPASWTQGLLAVPTTTDQVVRLDIKIK